MPIHWQREVTQWLRVFDALTEVESTVPGATSGGSQTPVILFSALFRMLRIPEFMCTYLYTDISLKVNL